MALEVFWFQLARDKLQDIFNYYRIKAGVRISKQIIDGIVNNILS